MKYRPYENPSTSKQASVIPWITGASIAFLALINLAMFFWSGQASFALLAFLCAVYLPTPLTNSRMDGVGAWSYFTSVAAALAYGAICAVQCWWITLLALVTTISATWLLYRQHRKQPFHLPRRPGMTFQCPSDQVWIPLYHFAMLLVFAILSMRSFPISISLSWCSSPCWLLLSDSGIGPGESPWSRTGSQFTASSVPISIPGRIWVPRSLA